MDRQQLRFGETFRYRFPQIVLACFIFMFALAGTIVVITTTGKTAWIAAIVFVIILALLVVAFLFFRVRRIETFKDRIVIYGKKFKDLNFIDSLKYGYTIKYSDIQTIDLYPIKTFGAFLTHQINLKMANEDTIFINQFSDLDRLCADMRQLLVYYRRHKDEFAPVLPVEEVPAEVSEGVEENHE